MASTAPSALTFISPKPGSASMLARSLGVGGVAPDARGVAVVVVADLYGEVVHACGHRSGKAMDRRLLAERSAPGRRRRARSRRASRAARGARADRRRPSARRPAGRARSRSATPSGRWRLAVGVLGVGEVELGGQLSQCYLHQEAVTLWTARASHGSSRAFISTAGTRVSGASRNERPRAAVATAGTRVSGAGRNERPRSDVATACGFVEGTRTRDLGAPGIGGVRVSRGARPLFVFVCGALAGVEDRGGAQDLAGGGPGLDCDLE